MVAGAVPAGVAQDNEIRLEKCFEEGRFYHGF